MEHDDYRRDETRIKSRVVQKNLKKTLQLHILLREKCLTTIE